MEKSNNLPQIMLEIYTLNKVTKGNITLCIRSVLILSDPDVLEEEEINSDLSLSAIHGLKLITNKNQTNLNREALHKIISQNTLQVS